MKKNFKSISSYRISNEFCCLKEFEFNLYLNDFVCIYYYSNSFDPYYFSFYNYKFMIGHLFYVLLNFNTEKCLFIPSL